MAAYLKLRAAQALHLDYEQATVVRVDQAGTGDRQERTCFTLLCNVHCLSSPRCTGAQHLLAPGKVIDSWIAPVLFWDCWCWLASVRVTASSRTERVSMRQDVRRVCVDLCSNMVPGEGMLVGSFARALFLVHSECAESTYINSRPFRVNAGPVRAALAPSACDLPGAAHPCMSVMHCRLLKQGRHIGLTRLAGDCVCQSCISYSRRALLKDSAWMAAQMLCFNRLQQAQASASSWPP